MEILGLIGYSMVGAVFWVINVEAMATVCGAQGWNPLVVGVTLATGQNLAYVIVYLGGDKLVRKWAWLQKKVQQARERVKGDLRRGFLGTAAIASAIGIPPALAMPALAPSFSVGLRTLIPIMFSIRIIRFTIFAWFGESIYAWWNAL